MGEKNEMYHKEVLFQPINLQQGPLLTSDNHLLSLVNSFGFLDYSFSQKVALISRWNVS